MDDKEYRTYEGSASAGAGIMALVVRALLCLSCKTREITQTGYKEVQVVMHDTIAQNIWRIDTTIVKDSVYFAVKGDTIFKERYNTKWRIKVAHDTINKVVEKPVEVLTKSAPAAAASRQTLTISASERRQVSMITLAMAPSAWHWETTAEMSWET